jgi:hypothetical protein
MDYLNRHTNVFCPNCNTELEYGMLVMDTNYFNCPNPNCKKSYEQDGPTYWGEKIKIKER